MRGGAKEVSGATFIKAMPLRDLSELDAIKNEVRSGNILILRVTPLAYKSVEDAIGGDIAGLGKNV